MWTDGRVEEEVVGAGRGLKRFTFTFISVDLVSQQRMSNSQNKSFIEPHTQYKSEENGLELIDKTVIVLN